VLSDLTKGASVTEVAIRLAVAVVIGGIIGWDRERSSKPAGLRTHMLVSLGSATFTLLGFEVGAQYSKDNFDPTRVLQGVVGGIGFLGAGAILQTRGQVSGITTAAGVWVAGALGAAAGVGAYVLALAATALAFGILAAAGPLDRLVGKRPPRDDVALDQEPHDEHEHSAKGAARTPSQSG
jgi:putative Mg2+ transporter-C (MgtC) family protein